jgi:hypothetical protein
MIVRIGCHPLGVAAARIVPPVPGVVLRYHMRSVSPFGLITSLGDAS